MKRILHFFKTNSRNVLIAIVVALILMILSYLGNNIRRPLLENNDYIRRIEYKHSNIIEKIDSLRLKYIKHAIIPNQHILINTAYDKVAIPKHDGDSLKGRVIGEHYITDRRKLIEFLEIAKESDYKYLIIDLDFSEELKDPCNDSIDIKFIDLLLSMKNIVIPAIVYNDGSHKELLDSRLNKIKYSAVNIGTWRINNLTPLPLLHDSLKSIPLFLFENNNHKYKEHALFSTIDKKLCYKKVFVYNYVKNKTIANNKGQHIHKTIYGNLYVDYLQSKGKKATIPIRLKNKIVIIGDFENDKINTYSGSQPGSLVLLNEYYSLMDGLNVVSSTLSITCFIIFFIIVFCIIQGWSFWSYIFERININKPRMKSIIVSLLGTYFSTTFFFNIIKIIYIYIFHIYFSVYVPVIILPIISILLNPKYDEYN